MKNKVVVVASLGCFKAVQLLQFAVFRIICGESVPCHVPVLESFAFFFWVSRLVRLGYTTEMQFDQNVVKTSFSI